MPELNSTILKNSSNLKAYYRFESGALTTDSSGNSHTLTAISDPAETTGKFGGGVELDGNDGYSHADHADFKPTGDFTVGAWIKTSTTGTQKTIFSSSGAFPSGFFLDITTANVPRFFVGNNAGGYNDQVIGTTNVCDGNWHLVIVTYVTATKFGRMYVDGKHEDVENTAISIAYNATNYVRVGCNASDGSDGEFFTGSLEDVFLLNGTALSADQIKELYEGRYVGEWWPQSGLVGLWHLNGNSTDFSGNNNHGSDTSITYSLSNGKFSQGAGFNGSNSRVNLANAETILGNNPSAWSVCCWFKTNTLANQNLITDYWSTSGGDNDFGMQLLITSSGFFQVGIRTAGTDYLVATSSSKADGKWHFGVMVVSKTINYIKNFLDGVEVGSTTINTTADYVQNSGNIIFGAQLFNNAYTNFLNGSLDEPIIFNRALTAQEIRRWYLWSKYGE